jgi:hypothetical protein
MRHLATIAAIPKRLEARVDRHLPTFSVIGYTLSFVVLFGGVVLAAYESGLAHAAGMQCGPMCVAIPGFEYAMAAMWGGAAILFVKLYARLAAVLQRVFVDPFEFVRPESLRSGKVVGWAEVLHLLIGLALSVAIAGFETTKTNAVVELCIGWWVGGRGVLRFFWPKPPGGAGVTLDHPD